MSMNIHIVATRAVIVEKTGKREFQNTDFNQWQTPTKVSYDIKKSNDPIQAYKDWVMSISEINYEPVYADDDVFGEREPIGTKQVNYGDYHIEKLDAWIASCIEAGYEISVEVW